MQPLTNQRRDEGWVLQSFSLDGESVNLLLDHSILRLKGGDLLTLMNELTYRDSKRDNQQRDNTNQSDGPARQTGVRLRFGIRCCL